jgi:hypothetical protein
MSILSTLNIPLLGLSSVTKPHSGIRNSFNIRRCWQLIQYVLLHTFESKRTSYFEGLVQFIPCFIWSPHRVETPQNIYTKWLANDCTQTEKLITWNLAKLSVQHEWSNIQISITAINTSCLSNRIKYSINLHFSFASKRKHFGEFQNLCVPEFQRINVKKIKGVGTHVYRLRILQIWLKLVVSCLFYLLTYIKVILLYQTLTQYFLAQLSAHISGFIITQLRKTNN